MRKNSYVLYRGEKYKVIDTNTLTINGQGVLILKLNHKKYDLWVNSNYVIEC